MIVLPSIFVAARVSIQIWKRQRMELPDYLIYNAFVCFLAMAICYLIVMPTIYGIGRVRSGLMRPGANFQNDRVFFFRMLFVTQNLFWISLWSVKLSLLGLYKKLMEGLPGIYKKLWWAVFAFCIASLIGCIISYFFGCPDFGGMMMRGDCVGSDSVRSQSASLYYSYAVDVVTDLMIIALPIKLVWNLQLARGQKIAVIALFASGFVCIAFATLRVVQVGMQTGNATSPSPSWLALWTIIETSIAVCIGCGPAFAVLYRKVVGTTHASRDTSGYLRQGPSHSGTARSKSDAIKLTSVTIGASRSRASKNDMYWDGGSSQEELAGGSKDIVVTTTVKQDTGPCH
ncbi:hypothetical protein M011DRAFT_426803 [Sporormia fimetaria CBS 119925]|uniref:Rhodopsin domain-containing protein n=1 Tax=Sporormia fimetaria CBS 119925 TaxID=1340428 RepID=A0A6A6V7L7_9PLEO|nr:hypothetical protein M011DRAFT_426803 [Sporormia fimetaria CBS 119925]